MAKFLNHYECPRCATSWSDEWSCTCDDRCPKCNLTCSPVDSEDVEQDADFAPCAACGKSTHINDLDAKPEYTLDGLFFRLVFGRDPCLSDAAERGEDFTRLECATCYGPGYVPGPTAARGDQSWPATSTT